MDLLGALFRKIQAFPNLTQYPVSPQTREPCRNWKATFHPVLRGFPRPAGAPVGATFTYPSPLFKDGIDQAPVRMTRSAEKTRPYEWCAPSLPRPQSVRGKPKDPLGPCIGQAQADGLKQNIRSGWGFGNTVWKITTPPPPIVYRCSSREKVETGTA